MQEIDKAKVVARRCFFNTAISGVTRKLAGTRDHDEFDENGWPSVTYHAQLVYARDLLTEIIKEIAKGSHNGEEESAADQRAK